MRTTIFQRKSKTIRPLIFWLGIAVLPQLSSCALPLVPFLAASAIGTGALVMTDRRTVGMQVEDKGIQSRVSDRIGMAHADGVHVNVTSFNRLVLLTGEVPNDKIKQEVGKIAASVENVTKVVNELAVQFNSSVSSRAKDSLITTKVKATFVDDSSVQANVFKVVTERGDVYLMGRVTTTEADAASDLTSRVSDVKKVVKVFEYISEEEKQKINNKKPDDETQDKKSIKQPAPITEPTK